MFRSALSRTAGVPGGSLEDSGLGEENVSAGIVGERMVANVITELMKVREDVYLFNSLKLPGQNWDIDHVLLVGRDMYVIDAKRWKNYFKYQIVASDRNRWIAYRESNEFSGGILSTTREAESLQRHLLNRENLDVHPRCMLVVASQGVSVNTACDDVTRMQLEGHSLETFRQEIKSFSEKPVEAPSKHLINALKKLCKTSSEQNNAWVMEDHLGVQEPEPVMAPVGVAPSAYGTGAPYTNPNVYMPPNYLVPTHAGGGMAIMIVQIVNFFLGAIIPFIGVPVAMYTLIHSIVCLSKRKGKLYYWITIGLSGTQLLFWVGMFILGMIATTMSRY